MLESKLQQNILKILKSLDFYIIRVVSASDRGVPDIIALKNGKFLAIEVKKNQYAKKHNLTKLQALNIDKINKCGGFAFVVCSKEDLLNKLNELHLID